MLPLYPHLSVTSAAENNKSVKREVHRDTALALRFASSGKTLR